MKILSDEFLNKYNSAPEHMNELGAFVYYRTYSRWLPEKRRRETWKETCTRAVEYNLGLEVQHRINSNTMNYLKKKRIAREAEELFDNMFNLKQFLSGRTLWVGGTEASRKYPLSNFNCAFVEVKQWEDMCDLFYLLLIGTGVGFKCSKKDAASLAPLHLPQKITHTPYMFNGITGRSGDMVWSGKNVTITIGDSKEGWVEAFKNFVFVLTVAKSENVNELTIVYDNVRPKGTRLKTFGGTASGHEPLRQMFESIEKMLKGELDATTPPPKNGQVRPIHVLDIGNLIGNNVVCGGVRRTAEIFLCDADDWESIFAKFGINGIWGDGNRLLHVIKEKMKLNSIYDTSVIDKLIDDPQCRMHLHHRRMSNNSVAFTSKPSKELLELLCMVMQLEGEPGFVNLEAAAKRRPRVKGLNPCAEILLDSYGVCNLTTLNLAAQWDSEEELLAAQALSARAGLRMTLAEMEKEHWNETQQRDRLLGVSLTGVQDAGVTVEMLEKLRVTANEEAEEYAAELNVNRPLLVTTVKPEGTLSQVAGGVSSGLHFSHSEYFIRRIRINAHDPLARAAKDLGWRVSPEVGQEWDTATTLVIDFPVYSPAKRHKEDVRIDEQLRVYLEFQRHYSDHNSSNTIHVRPDEWSTLAEKIYGIWDDYIGISFLAHNGGTYKLAPYEACSKEEHEELKKMMKPFNVDMLNKYDSGVELDVGSESCEGGACPVR